MATKTQEKEKRRYLQSYKNYLFHREKVYQANRVFTDAHAMKEAAGKKLVKAEEKLAAARAALDEEAPALDGWPCH